MKNIYKVLILSLIIGVNFACQKSSTGSKTAESASGNITMDFDFSKHDKYRELKLWVPYPVSNEFQDITNIKLKGNYNDMKIYKDTKYKFPVLYVKWDKGIENRKFSFSFNARRNEVKKRNLTEKNTASNFKDLGLYLQPTTLGPIDGNVKKLSEKITRGKTTVLEKTKAIYDWVCSNMYRDPKTIGCGSGNVCLLLKKRGGKCVDISSVFISLTKASGIPAREIFGIRLGKKPVQNITAWYHCWAEFYLPGTGWVPVDPGDVRKMMLEKNLKEKSVEAENFKKYFWGGIDPYRIKLSTGRDLTLNYSNNKKRINYLMYPYAQTGNNTINWLDPDKFKYKITYKKQAI